jgi:hypothetical protein
MNIDQDHYTIKELAAKWHSSYNTIKRLFEHEPGVLRLRGAPAPKGHRRTYSTWKIPREVAERVYRRSMQVGRVAE